MRTFNAIQKKISLLVIAILATGISYGAVFTAIASGSWSTASTWGVAIPPFDLTTDQVVIPAGINVTLANNLSVNGPAGAVAVEGTLSSGNIISVGLGAVTGAGNINVESLVFETGSVFAFTGTVVANSVTNYSLSIQTYAAFTVNQTITLMAGVLDLYFGSAMNFGNNATINIAGGTIGLSGGTLNLSNPYNVVYTDGVTSAGVELTGSGLQNITVNLSSGDLSLTDDLVLNGILTLTSGDLILNGHGFIIAGDIAASGNGSLVSTIASDIVVTNPAGLTGTIRFSASGNSVHDFVVNVGTANQVMVSGGLTVSNTLVLTSGILNFSNTSLILNGTISGPGYLSGNASANLSLGNGAGIANPVIFITGGQTVGNLTVNVGTGNYVVLSSNLTVEGTLNLSNQSDLNISGMALTIGSGGTVIGTGSLVVNFNSEVTINSTSGISSPLSFTGTLGTLTINTPGSSVVLGSPLSISGILILSEGTLVLNNNNLTISGDLSGTGNGTIFSTSTSDVTINGPAFAGVLTFAAGGNTVNDFTVSIADPFGAVAIGSDLHVNGVLHFVSGRVNIGPNELSIAASGAVSGGRDSSYVITAASGSLSMQVTAGTDSVMFPVGTSVSFAPASIHLATGSSSGRIGVGVISEVMAEGTTGIDISASQPLVDATWNIHSDIVFNMNMEAEMMWSSAMEVNSFNRADAYISHYTGGNWDMTTRTSANTETNGMFSLKRTGTLRSVHLQCLMEIPIQRLDWMKRQVISCFKYLRIQLQIIS